MTILVPRVGENVTDPGNLIVEDGTAKADADAYITLTEAVLYLSRRGNTTFAALPTATQEHCIREATSYMVNAYRLRWKGYRTTDRQALDWPRADVSKPDSPGAYGTFAAVYDDDVVPEEVRYACALLALKASTAELAPDIQRAVKREKVGALEVEYSDGALPYTIYRNVEAMLLPLFKAGGGSARLLVRA